MNFNPSRIDPGQEAVKKQREKLKNRWENNTFWHKLKRGPVAAAIHSVIIYPRVFIDHICSRPLHPSYTVGEEAAIRSIKRTMNSSLPVIRQNVSFYESMMKNVYCSEPFIPMKDETDVKGYWLGAELWKGKHSEATLFYIHGGGYVSASPQIGLQALCYLLETLRTKYDKHIRAFAVEYSLAPENQFPAGLNDVERAYQWLTSSDIPGSRNVFLCGDSAGGTIVLALLQKIYSDNIVMTFAENSIFPLGSILISPWVEASCESLSYITNSKYDTMSSYFCQFSAENYVFGKEYKSNVTERRNTLMIIDWLSKVETIFDFVSNDGDYGNEKNNRRRSSSIFNRENNNGKRNSINTWREWKHEVVQVRTHSGEGIPTGRYSRGSRRNSLSSRRVYDSSIIININSENNNDIPQADASSSPKVQQNEQNEQNGQNEQQHENAPSPIKMRNSKIRFSDSLEIHIQTDLDNTKNVRRGSWIRKSSQLYEIPLNSPPQSPQSPQSPQLPQLPQLPQPPQLPVSTNKIKENKETSASNPFENPLISPLRLPNHILAKFPPLFISYGGKEIFRDDIEKFCKKCIESKKVDINNDEKQSHPDVVIEVDEGMVHNYPILLNIFGKRSKNALSRMADFLNTHIPNVRTSSILRNSPTLINDQCTPHTTNINNDSPTTNDLSTINDSPTTNDLSTINGSSNTDRFSSSSIIKEVKDRFSKDELITEILNRFDTEDNIKRDSITESFITESFMAESITTEVDSEIENFDRIDPKRLSLMSTDSPSTLQPLRPVYMPIQSIRPIVSPKQPIYPSIKPIISSLQPIQPIQSSYSPRSNSLFLPRHRSSQLSRFSQYGGSINRFSQYGGSINRKNSINSKNDNVQFRTNIITPNEKSSRQIVTSKEIKVPKTSPVTKRVPSTKSTIGKYNVIEANSRTISFVDPVSRRYY